MIEAVPIFDVQSNSGYESNISSVEFKNQSLTIVVDFDYGEEYEITFNEQVWAFRYMEEGDLRYYWESGEFKSGHLIYEILKGGWLSKEGSEKDILGIARSENWLKEWFVVTKNFSFVVLSNSLPFISRLQNA
ncbi:MAG: hypothetical protein ABJH06_17440 [Paraglaciecola sp.]|uniref:hypothetical protein n=1 Tax=Paraglaciecola sp. TaxID=1920173 RepID=UPI003264795D